ncbi:MAG: TetR family transcriptional regulator [Acidobacteria bacterium]|nr:TetR family transcriptional regulator [Acidobacteriota bacterium]
MKKPTRARSSGAKDERRTVLLDAGRRLFEDREYEAVTMSALASEAGLAKGTAFLYFPTKEALFLEVLNRELDGWLAALEGRLVAASGHDVPRVIADSLRERPVLLRLLPLLHVTLERNIDDAALATWKKKLLVSLLPAASLLEVRLRLPPGEGLRLLLRAHVLVVGLSQVARPAPRIQAVLDADPGLRPFQIDFQAELEALLAAVVDSMRKPGRTR